MFTNNVNRNLDLLTIYYFGGRTMRKVQKCLLTILLCLGLQTIASAAVWEVSPWTDDASTGIDSSKTYTHAINNSSSGNIATVNGVEFTNSWGDFDNGSLEGWGRIDWDSGNNIAGQAAGSSYELSTHFRYGNSKLTLTGLDAGSIYHLTLFGVAWEDGTRMVTLTTGDGSTFVFNEDMYGNNNGVLIDVFYIADANGELVMNMVNDFHFYAFANCEYTGVLPVVISGFSPADYIPGVRVETDANLEWKEEFAGSLTDPGFDVYFSTDEAKVAAMDAEVLVSPKQPEFSYAPALDPNTFYYWRVAAYVDINDADPNKVTDVLSFKTVFEDEHWADAPWTDDSNSGISAGKVYTHKVNFNASEATTTDVNGVKFENDNTRDGSNWFLAGADGATGGGHQVAGDGGALVTNMVHGSGAVLTLTGLTPGTDYVLTQFTRGWGDVGGRLVAIETSADNRSMMIDGNHDGNEIGHLFMYSYTAPASGELVMTFDPLVANDTWHHYAFSNEIAVPAYVDPTPLPAASVNSDVELSWVMNGDVVNPTYNLKVATDAGMTSLVVNESGLSSTAHTPYLTNDTEYFWQVEIVEDDASVIYTSPVWSFITTPPQDALKVIEWKFDETTGTIAEQTGPTEDADGIMVGFNDPNTPGVSHVPGLVNNGLYLNGKDEYVDVSHAEVYMPTNDGQSFAISGYIRTFGSYGPLFSMRNSETDRPIIDIALGANGVADLPGVICMIVRDDVGSNHGDTTSVVQVNDGRWHNFIVTRVGGKWTLYVDGQSRGIINGAGTGDVSLNMMSIGTSLRWLADEWNPGREYYRFFDGIVDEYTVWSGELQPHQIAELAAIVPGQGDVDFDLDTDIDDLAGLTTEWLAADMVPVQATVVLEDMETYETGSTSFVENWPYTPEDDFGDMVMSVLPDPNDTSLGQVMKIEYDFSTGGLHAHTMVTLPNRGADLKLYDTVNVRIKKSEGCELSRIIMDFMDARGIVDPAAEDVYGRGRMTINIDTVPANEWVVVSGDISGDYNTQACSDLYQIQMSFEDGGADTGTLFIDSIELTDETLNCVPEIGSLVPDFNGDCTVNLTDFAEIAEGWLSSN